MTQGDEVGPNPYTIPTPQAPENARGEIMGCCFKEYDDEAHSVAYVNTPAEGEAEEQASQLRIVNIDLGLVWAWFQPGLTVLWSSSCSHQSSPLTSVAVPRNPVLSHAASGAQHWAGLGTRR